MIDALALAAPGVRGLAPYVPGKPLEELEREYGVRGAIKLASNENPLGPGPRARAAALRALADCARYPDGNGYALKRALAARLEVAPEAITLGNGSNDVLELVARAFATAGDEIVFSQYAFAVYAIVTQAVGARAVVVPARDYGHDLEAMRAAVTARTRLVFIANPNNPTGTWLEAEALRSFVASLPRHVLVVVDEAYHEYVEAQDYASLLPEVARCAHLIVTRTFSKAYGLAGLRVGYAISDPAVAEVLNRVRQPFNVNSVALAAAAAALEDEEHLAHAVALVRQERRRLQEGLAALGFRSLPSVGNFLCIDLAQPAAPVYERLLREGVIVRPLANYDMPHHLRVSVGLPEENERFLQALAKVTSGAQPVNG
jgi:histidinol-phosphate aminotransferase